MQYLFTPLQPYLIKLNHGLSVRLRNAGSRIWTFGQSVNRRNSPQKHGAMHVVDPKVLHEESLLQLTMSKMNFPVDLDFRRAPESDRRYSHSHAQKGAGQTWLPRSVTWVGEKIGHFASVSPGLRVPQSHCPTYVDVRNYHVMFY